MSDKASILKRLASHCAWWKYLSLDRRRGRGCPESREQWDRDYASGEWDKLASLSEAGRFGVITAYILRLKPRAKILDLGCGPGLLLNYLPETTFSEYHGVDLSLEAIRQAKIHWDLPHIQFERQTIETFTSRVHYDVIICNEVLYYLSEPIAVLQRLSKLLSDEGVFVISMVEPSGHYIWERLMESFTPVDRQQVINSSGTTWNVGVYQP